MMPVLFFGHGSPMNAIQNNAFTRTLTQIGVDLPRPQAILCVSAHWTTQGTFITSSEKPKMLYDMYGFPEELYKIKYEAAGDLKLAKNIQSGFSDPKISLDYEKWGLDHGSWGILKYLYPNADIPVLQLSIDMTKSPQDHFEIGQQLQALRSSGVLILGSGNVTHNLRNISRDENEIPFDWAVEFDEWFKKRLLERDFNSINKNYYESKAGQMSLPTLDHYLPIQYILGASQKNDELKFEYEGMQNGSVSMRAFRFG